MLRKLVPPSTLQVVSRRHRFMLPQLRKRDERGEADDEAGGAGAGEDRVEGCEDGEVKREEQAPRQSRHRPSSERSKNKRIREFHGQGRLSQKRPQSLGKSCLQQDKADSTSAQSLRRLGDPLAQPPRRVVRIPLAQRRRLDPFQQLAFACDARDERWTAERRKRDARDDGRRSLADTDGLAHPASPRRSRCQYRLGRRRIVSLRKVRRALSEQPLEHARSVRVEVDAGHKAVLRPLARSRGRSGRKIVSHTSV